MKFQFYSVEKNNLYSESDWNSWSWQMRHSLKTQEDFSKIFKLTPSEKKAFQGGQKIFNIRSTLYYAELCLQTSLDKKSNQLLDFKQIDSKQIDSTEKIFEDPLRKILMPSMDEFSMGAQSQLDPLGEKKFNPTSRIIHRYPDRVLFLVTDLCSVYCRYCTRKHFTGQEQVFIKQNEYELALQYIRKHKGIREVILSGGDPLTLSDNQLVKVLSDLREIDHIEIIRLGTRMPVVCPMRITEHLIQAIKPFRPLYMMTHFNHPRELSLQAKQALDLIVDGGIPTFNQMVLLNGVNNHPAIVQALSRRLLYLRVKPYYMFQADPSQGTDHLRTTLEESEEIQKSLWGTLSGLAMPQLSVDIPSGGGKAYLVPNFEISRNQDKRLYKGYDGIEEFYVNPSKAQKKTPYDVHEYEQEWLETLHAKSSAEN